MSDNNPLLSVSVITYNHEKYIRQSIESILAQKTNFQFDIHIGDDGSNDCTAEICMEYAEAHQGRVYFYQRDRTAYDKKYIHSGRRNFVETMLSCRGKYIALMDGDDYWTDPHKLQKQVDFLEANEGEYVACTHVAEERNEFDGASNLFPSIGDNTEKNIQDYILENCCATASLVFLAKTINPLPDWFKYVPFGDWALMLYLLESSQKRVYILKDCMSVYRVHQGGIHGYLKKDTGKLAKAHLTHVRFVEFANKYIIKDPKYNNLIILKKLTIYRTVKKLMYKRERFSMFVFYYFMEKIYLIMCRFSK